MSAPAVIKIGFIGAGNVLWAYLQAIDRLAPRGHATLGPVCARRRETWPELKRHRPDLQLVESPQEVAESDVDVIVIITSPASHAELTRLAMENGKHVVVEKPLAATRAEGEALAEMASGKGLHLMAAPFVQLAPTFVLLWELVQGNAIGRVHSARGLYGNAGSTWARWYHLSKLGPVGEVGIYNLKTLTALLGPVAELTNIETTAMESRNIAGEDLTGLDPDVSHLILRHDSGALSSVVSSHAIQRYRRPAIELYGIDGTANLLGDDWDPRGIEVWRNDNGYWENYEPVDSTWLWTDGLQEIVATLRTGRAPRAEIQQDLHLLEVLEAAQCSAETGKTVKVSSRFPVLALQSQDADAKQRHHVHDHTRPADLQ